MPGWLTELLKVLGFTTPFVYAAAAYGVFHWLDKKASLPARNAMRAWIQSDTKIDTTNVIVGLFDRIYTHPLLAWRAFGRSAAITIVVCCLIWAEERMFQYWIRQSAKIDLAWLFVLFALISNVLSDYVSLFAVRKSLLLSKSRPLASLLAGTLAGVLIVLGLYLVRLILLLMVRFLLLEGAVSPSDLKRISLLAVEQIFDVYEDRTLYPALAVHLWLPLFGVAIVIAQALTWLARAAGWMQWFLKQGRDHPFEAVGLVASGIVFVGSVVLQYAWR
jgi:hypothetical protein